MEVRFAIAALLVACGPGVGRPAIVRDATVQPDAGSMDAEPSPDAAPRDAGSGDVGVFVPDSGDPTRFPFTGVFGILNANDSLFAREVDDRLMLIVGRPPYIYTGTIDEAGEVEAVSAPLERSGCVTARITGTYDRVAATYELLHETCSEMDGSPLESTIRGGFFEDFAGASGNYELTATVIQDLTGCSIDNQPRPVRAGVNILRDGTIAFFTGVDLFEEAGVYVGRLTGSGAGFSAVFSVDAAGTQEFGMSGMFAGLNANEPIMLMGERDVWDPAQNCSFRVMLDGQRSEAP
jgi:hypothetical protein